jgi:hypothetical protein
MDPSVLSLDTAPSTLTFITYAGGGTQLGLGTYCARARIAREVGLLNIFSSEQNSESCIAFQIAQSITKTDTDLHAAVISSSGISIPLL